MDDGQFTVVSTPLPPFFFSRLLSSRGKEFVPRMAGLQKKIKDSPSPVLLILPAASICSSRSSVSTTTSVQWTLFITQPHATAGIDGRNNWGLAQEEQLHAAHFCSQYCYLGKRNLCLQKCRPHYLHLCLHCCFGG